MAELSDKDVFGDSPQREWTDSEIFGKGPSQGTAMPGQLGALAGKAAGEVRKALAQKDEGIDYSGVPDILAQASYSLITKPEDRTAYLKSRYGAENVTQDSFGRDVVNIDGKKVAFKARDDQPFLQGLASHGGDVLPVTGMVVGGIAGAPAGGAGSILGAGAGAAGGEAINQAIASAMGLPNTQTSGERAGDVWGAAGTGAAAELGGQGIQLAGRTLMGPYKPGSLLNLYGPNSKQEAFDALMAEIKAARDLGLRPKVGTFAPNASLVQRTQQAGNRIFGDETAAINRPVLQGEADRLTAEAGGGAVGTPDVNAALSRRADLTLERAKYNADIAMQDARKTLQSAEAEITKDVGSPTGKLAGQVNESIRTARSDFATKASELYAPIDEMAGKPVVPTATIKEALDGVVSAMPPTKGGDMSVLTPSKLITFKKGIDQLPDYVSFQQMQAIRNTFRNASEVNALDAGLTERQAKLLANAADAAFDAAGSSAFAGVPEAAQALRRADMFYKAGMKRFDNLSIQALVKEAGETGFVQPEKVANFIATPNQVDKLDRIFKVISPEARQQVGAEKWKSLIDDSRDIFTGQIDGKKLSKQLNDLGPVLDRLYPGQANQMRNLARQWAVLGGKAEEISEPAAIRNALESSQKVAQLQKNTWMMNLGKNGSESLQAADYLTQPQNRYIFNQARQTFGEGSAEIAATKEYLARKIFSTMEVPATKGAEKYGKTELMGQPLLAELNRYGRPYLEDVFGKQWTDSAFNFARAAETGTRKNPSDAGAIVSAAMALSPLTHLGGLVKLFGGKELLSTGPVISYMTRGLETGRFGDVIREITRGGIAYEAQTRPKEAQEYVRGVRNKINSQMTAPQQAPNPIPAGMNGVRG